jgi:excisionase family DNA binding protein
LLLTVAEAATIFRTSRKAAYAMIGRGSMPGVTRIGRRVLVRSAILLEFLTHNSTPSPREHRR